MSAVAETERPSSMLAQMEEPTSNPDLLCSDPSSRPEVHTPSTVSSRPELTSVSAVERSAVPNPASSATPQSLPYTPSSRPEGQSPAAERPAFPATTSCEATFCQARTEAAEPVLPGAQRRWAARPLPERIQVLRKARHWMAAHPETFARAISTDLPRASADTLVTELLPLLDAIRFLERNALRLLRPARLGSKGRPIWLTGVQAEIHREPLGHVLVIGPGNFPLFLPGVQTVQALLAGNAVTWKPGAGGEKVALLFAHVLREAGLPRGILHVTDDSVEAARTALAPENPAQHPDKVVFTGSFNTGRQILRELAETATPATMELSGADAVVVLPSADLNLTARAIGFGLRLNGAEVCMSPRRLIATRETLKALRPLLQAELAKVPAVPLKPSTAALLADLLTKSLNQGATQSPLSPFNPIPLDPSSRQEPTPLDLSSRPEGQSPAVERPASPAHAPRIQPILLDNATAQTAMARSDIFAPVLSLIEAPSVLHMADLVNDNPYALTAAIFGDAREADTLATQLRVGTVLINDLIAPTADPRVPFGGRARSGFGVTRGAEGLLDMTATKTILKRRRGSTRHYDPLGSRDLPLFAGLIGALHGATLGERWRSIRQTIAAGRDRSR